MVIQFLVIVGTILGGRLGAHVERGPAGDRRGESQRATRDDEGSHGIPEADRGVGGAPNPPGVSKRAGIKP